MTRSMRLADCGVVVNPMLVEGQVMGGTAQGLGGILCEAIAYDASGQLLSGTLMDYALPTASDIPAMQVIHQHSPSPLNPLGVKGVGEGGAVAPPAAIANAVCDALAPFGGPLGLDPLGLDPLGLDPLGLDPLGLDPLGLELKARNALPVL